MASFFNLLLHPIDYTNTDLFYYDYLATKKSDKPIYEKIYLDDARDFAEYVVNSDRAKVVHSTTKFTYRCGQGISLTAYSIASLVLTKFVVEKLVFHAQRGFYTKNSLPNKFSFIRDHLCFAGTSLIVLAAISAVAFMWYKTINLADNMKNNSYEALKNFYDGYQNFLDKTATGEMKANVIKYMLIMREWKTGNKKESMHPIGSLEEFFNAFNVVIDQPTKSG